MRRSAFALLTGLILSFSGLYTPAQAQPTERVVLQLSWMHQFQFAGYYAAKEKGFYADAGLDVDIVPGGPGISVSRAFSSGSAQYGVGTSTLLLDHFRGMPVMALAAIFQHSPTILLARADSGITSPSDAVGKRIMITPGNSSELMGMFHTQGVRAEDFIAVPLSGNADALIRGDVEAMAGYLTNEPFAARQAGLPVNIIRTMSHGIDFYGDCLYTSRHEYTAHHDRADRFLQASLKGWRYAMQNPAELVDIITAKYAPDKSRAHLFSEAETMRELILPRLVEIGTMNRTRWEHISRTYKSLGLAPEGASLEGFLPDGRQFSRREALAYLYWGGLIVVIAGLGALALYVLNRRLRGRLMAERRTMDTILSISPFGLFLCRDRTIVWCNEATANTFGIPMEQLLGSSTRIIYCSDEDFDRVGRALDEAARGSGETMLDIEMARADGTTFFAQLSLRYIEKNAPGQGYISSLVNITQRIEAERGMRLAANVFTQSSESVIITDRATRILDCNDAFTRITGYACDEVRGKTPRLLKSGRHERAFYERMWSSIARDGVWHGEIWNRKKDGELFPVWLRINAVYDDTGSIANFVGTFSDLTKAKQSEESIYRLNNFDVLTELPNRALFQNLLTQEISHARGEGASAGVMVLDLENFKSVNESLGIASGDELLQQAAQRLRTELGDGLTPARLGSDEFAVLFTPREDVATLIETVQEVLARPFALSRGEVALGCTVGVSMFPEDADNAEDLLSNAENALHHAFTKGLGSYSFFSREMTERASERLRLATALRHALTRDELVLYYQPKVELATGRIRGAEALVRWMHPEWGMVPPDRFIGIAESSGMILPIGEWVLREACSAQKRLLDAGHEGLRMAINVSPRQFLEADIRSLVREALDDVRLDARHVELEITEALLVKDVDLVAKKLEEVKGLGVTLAVDDFGTGYSSLAYLSSFPLDTLKIDRSFIDGMESDERKASITQTVAAMARTLDLSVVAEGVENETHVAMLNALSCGTAQGYYYSRPVPEDEFAAMLATGLPLPDAAKR